MIRANLMTRKQNKDLGEHIAYEQNGSSIYENIVDTSFEGALKEESKLDEWVLDMQGMSGKCFRHFLNNLASKMRDCRYLEIGSWKGSTTIAFGYDNPHADMTICDNWSLFGGPEKEFHHHLNRMHTQCRHNKISFHNEDFRKLKLYRKYNVYFFDGPHEEKDQFDGLHLMLKYMNDEFIFIVDDYNWVDRVQAGTKRAIRRNELTVLKSIELTTTCGGHGKDTRWHNGIGIFIMKKRQQQ